jgi:hypothetical protein
MVNEMEKKQNKKNNQYTKEVVTPLPLRVNSIKKAKKLLSRCIYQMQKGEITDQKGKNLAYMIQVFLMVVKDSELEERITELEKRIGTEGLNDE